MPSTARTAWLMVALLLPVALLNYLDRQMLSSMKKSVMQDIPSIVNDENWGFMLGQFKWVYAFLSPLGGYLADRVSKRWSICGSLFVWSAVTFATGQVTSYSELLWARTLMGISEAFYIPAALALISDYHSGGTRSRAVGFHQMAIYLGGISGGFSGYIADDASLGWRFAFAACGVVGMAYALPLLVLLRDMPKQDSNPTATNIPTQLRWRDLLFNRNFVLIVLYFTLPAMAAWIVRDWMPAVLREEFHLSQGKAGVAATLPWQLAAIVGAIFGGWAADRWVISNPRGRIYTSALGTTLIAPAIFGMGHASTLTIAILFLIVFGLGWGLFDSNNMPILCQIVRPGHRATGYGIMNFVSISCGGLADWGFGVLRKQGVPLQQSFGAFAMVAAISVVLVLCIRPTIPSDKRISA